MCVCMRLVCVCVCVCVCELHICMNLCIKLDFQLNMAIKIDRHTSGVCCMADILQ